MIRLRAPEGRRAQDPRPAGERAAERRPTRQRRRTSIVLLVALGAVVLASLGLHLWGLMGDLPYPPDVDEPIFVGAAVRMLEHRSLNPAWFGHPGSTVIYPIAALVEAWYLVAKHVPPFAHAMPGIGREFAADPTPFYVIGRLVSVAYGVGCVVATWLVARRVVGDAGGVLAALLLPASSIVVAYGQLVRTDTAGMFFALVALWLALRAMEDGRTRDWAVTAIAIGLAVSTRYFYAMLVVPYCVAAWLWFRSPEARSGAGDRIGGWSRPLVALLLTPVAFAITSPFVLLKLPKAVAALRAEAGTVHPGADGLTPIDNLLWYLGQVVPATFGPALLVLAVVGVIVVARRDWRGTAVIAAFAISYLLAVSASPLHWDRYVIPLVPIVGIFVAGAVLAIGGRLASAIANLLPRHGAGPSAEALDAGRGARHGPLAIGIAAAILIALLVPSALAVAQNDRLRATPSTRVLATEWIRDNLPRDSRIAVEMYTVYRDGTGLDTLRVGSLATRSLDAYRSDGYRFLVTSSSMANRFRDPLRYPTESAFYRSLEATGHLVASFRPGRDRAGPLISVYEIPGP